LPPSFLDRPPSWPLGRTSSLFTRPSFLLWSLDWHLFFLAWPLSWHGGYPSGRWEYLKGPQTSRYWPLGWFLFQPSFGQQACHYLFCLHSMAIWRSSVVFSPVIQSSRSVNPILLLRQLSHVWVIIDTVWIGNWIYWTLTTCNYKDYALTVLHTSQITIGHTKSSQPVTVFTSHCLVATSNSGHSSSSGLPNCPRSQLPASQSYSSQQLNPSGYLTHSLH
jgi:hypothetical protein